MTVGTGGQGQIPAGFTYLGQFTDHDLTFDQTIVTLGDKISPAQLVQNRSPSLDLDSLYGAGPADPESAKFYEADGSHLKELTHNDDPDFAPVFSPDGTRIAYDSIGDVRVMRTDGSHKHRLTFDPATDEYADWGPRP
jgi:hypothetical protein